MRIVVIAVGKVRDRALRDATDEYLARLRRYVPVDEVELAEGAPAKVDAAFVRATKDAHPIALEIDGIALDSERFASELERLSMRGKGDIAFWIGGADGLSADLRKRAHAAWSLSRLTFPHRLARLVLVEQIYRAMTILRGEPYAH